MRVVVSGYVGKKITGIGRNLINLLNNTDDNNEYIIYVNKDMQVDFAGLKKNITIKTYNVSKFSSLKNLLWTTFVFPRKAKKEKADFALIPNFTLLLFKRVPTILIMHDLIEFNVKNKFSKKKMFYRTKIADPISAKRADRIITVSNNSKNDIIKFLKVKSEKIDVIYNGVDRNKFKKIPHDEYKTILKENNINYNFILCVGTIDHPGKNAYSLIKAFELLKENNQYDGKLVLAGMPGSGYDIVEAEIKKSKYADDIVVTGYISDNVLVALYNACDLFCFLSLYEGFGIPPLEALACGAKVIVSNKSSLPEVVGDVGLSIEPTDVENIALTIKNCFSMPYPSSEKLEKHLENFNWLQLSAQFEEAIKRGKRK